MSQFVETEDMKVAVLISSDTHEPGKNCIISGSQVLKARGFDVIVGPSYDSFKSDPRLPSATVLVAGPRCDVPSLSLICKAAPSIRWMHSWIAGLDTYRPFLLEQVDSPLTITNARGAYSAPLAEWLIVACCYFEKTVSRVVQSQSEAKWDRFRMGELRGKTVGFVGWGHIAQTCAKLCRAFDMKVIALRRHSTSTDTSGLADEMLPAENKTDLFRRSDFVVCALPGGAETKHFCSTAEFTAMKPTGVFVSIGRGSCVDEAALVEVLKSKVIRGAALDVFEVEPLPVESPLWKMENALLTAHIADWTHDYETFANGVFEANLKAFEEGGAFVTPVNKKLGY